MKRLMLMLCVAAALTACGDGYNEGNDGSGINSPGDQLQPDTTTLNDTVSYERSMTSPRDSM